MLTHQTGDYDGASLDDDIVMIDVAFLEDVGKFILYSSLIDLMN
jgi:hypothetical protein